jgi:DNA invertase Pin-like site-specific DNA recombinase
LRVSTKEQDYENQRPALEAIARARGFEITGTYSEDASTRKRRPEFERMLDDARRGKFDVLLIWAIDRFGRDTIGNLLAVADLDRAGVSVVSDQEEWLDTSEGPMRELLIFLFSWIAKQERDRRAQRTKAGLARAKAEGKRIGRRHRMSPVDVEKARALRAEGRTMRQIAMALKISRPTIQRALAQNDRRVRGSD